MNENTVEVADVGIGPGTMLRLARENRGLEIPAVAAMLHLSEAKLQCLEADDFEKLPEPVFVRGYLRNYARLMEEPEAAVLEAYSRYQPTLDIAEQPPLDSHVAVEVNSNHGAVRLATIIIGVILITLPLIWWWDNLEQAAQRIVGSATPESEQTAVEPEAAKAEAELAQFIPPPPPGSSEAEKPEAEPEPAAAEPAPAPEPVMDTSTTETAEPTPEPVVEEKAPEPEKTGSVIIPLPPKAKEVIEKVKPAVEEKVAKVELPPVVEKEVKPRIKAVIRKPAPVVKPVPVPAPAPKPAAAPVASRPAVVANETVFEFVESSWVKVRDASNQVILIGEYKKGEKKRLSGRTPYKVVLGNSPAVRVTIDGKSANLDRFSSGGVARFTISDGKILSP